MLDALGDPALYAASPASVERHETHGSWVFVAGDEVLKVKKPIVLPFLDYGTLERRRQMCREEVRLNRRLAPEVYRGTVALVAPANGTGWQLDDDDHAPGTVEVAVAMRRYDERDTLAAHLEDGRATARELRALGSRLARFHAEQARTDCATSALAALRQAVRTTLDDLERHVERLRLASLRGMFESQLAARRGELLERAERGLVVDGHGDLRAKHVVFAEQLAVVDALEFDPALRIGDVSCDLGFLVMELNEHPDLLQALLQAYRDSGGDPGDPRLLAVMGAYRALVRTKVDVVRGEQGDELAATRAGWRLATAERLAWRARMTGPLVVCGPPASGKSTLAGAIRAASGGVHLSSDAVRKERLGLASTDRAPESAYAHEETLATYRELGRRAAEHPNAAAVIDATLGEVDARAALRDGLGAAAELARYIEVRVPSDEAQRRAAARLGDASRVSDATPEVAARLEATWAPLDEVPANRHAILRGDRDVGTLVHEVAAWLDR